MSSTTLVTVMPAYNEGERLHTFLQDWATTACAFPHPHVTAVVVDDGSHEPKATAHQRAVEAAQRALTAGGAPHHVEYVRMPRNQGKGAAICFGWDSFGSSADWLGFIDSDGALPAREFWRLAAMLPSVSADAVCGSRIKMAGRTVERSMFRHLQGRTFATAVDELFHLGLYDTQCGLKFFRTSAVAPILPTLQETRWLLDVELLARLQRRGANVLEMPVDCHQHGASSLVVGVDSVKMFVRLIGLRRRLGAMDHRA
jgi:dolichyl-phosphate beta-glucosyltransferase